MEFLLPMKHESRMIHRLGEILSGRGAKKGLADAIGKPPSVISDICSGKDRLNDDLIEIISRALRIPPWHLFVDPESVYPTEHRNIVSAYLALNPGRREAVDTLLFTAQGEDPALALPENTYATMHDSAGENQPHAATKEDIERTRKHLRSEI